MHNIFSIYFSFLTEFIFLTVYFHALSTHSSRNSSSFMMGEK